jgi:hypothetical protein
MWLMGGLAMFGGHLAARKILVPRDAPHDLGRADRMAVWRTWIGFIFVAFASRPYKAFGGHH